MRSNCSTCPMRKSVSLAQNSPIGLPTASLATLWPYLSIFGWQPCLTVDLLPLQFPFTVTMKFLSVALLTLFGSSQAKTISKRRVLDQKKLLRAAVPVNRQGERRVEEQQQGQQQNNGGVEISAYHSIQFNECLSLSAQPEDETIFGDDYIAYTKSGQIVPQKSYVLFNVCETESSCRYVSDENLYMVDLATYMGAMVEYFPNKLEKYCQACNDAQDYCV